MPGNGAESMWYSYNVGRVHYVAISTETDFEGAAYFFDRFGDQMA